MIKKIFLILEIIPKLGYWNFGYAAWYKFSLKLGIRKRWFPLGDSVSGVFFHEVAKLKYFPKEWESSLLSDAIEIMDGTYTYFSYHKFKLGIIPDWFLNPFTNQKHSQIGKHWTEINDFGEGDIKIIWELSRFDWLTTLARAYRVKGESTYLDRINKLLQDWTNSNPLNQGPNWKCGQETAIRLMKLITTIHILDQTKSSSISFQKIIMQHLERIAPNLNYAISQDNNHGTSEAGGLYIGASYLLHIGYKDDRLENWKKNGRNVLEERVLTLIQHQGTFSQRSMTYHRVLVDTMTFVMHFMELLSEKPFAKNIENRLFALGIWQYKMTFGKKGDAPNFGNNDGAMLENLHSNGYLDFRVSTQVFFYTLNKKVIYQDLKLNEAIFWRYDITSQPNMLEIELPPIEILDNQMLIIRNEKCTCFLKIPEDSFRSGNDAFHIDFWVNGDNILRDNGTYSYNDPKLTIWFKSVSAHNTIQFGNHEQMPKISRFLNGKWIKPLVYGEIENNLGQLSWQGSYKDYKNNIHSRKITLTSNKLQIEDNTTSSESATLHLHFNQENVKKHNIIIETSTPSENKQTPNSSYYLQKKEDSACEVHLIKNLITILQYNQ